MMLSDEDILERGGTQEDIDSYAHDIGGACGAAYGGKCDQCVKPGAMTNQASEGELDNALRAIYGAGYLANQIDLELEDGEPMLEAAIGAACKSVESIIRAEKLKLLAEVRERVVGEIESKANLEPYGDRYSTVHDRNTLRGEQNIALTKLEAEL